MSAVRVPRDEERSMRVEEAMGRLLVYRANDTKTLYVTLHSLLGVFLVLAKAVLVCFRDSGTPDEGGLRDSNEDCSNPMLWMFFLFF